MFKAKILNDSKVVQFTRNHPKSQCKFHLDGQGDQFSNPTETFRCSKNSSSWKVNSNQFLKINTKILGIWKASLTLKIKVKVTNFQTLTFGASINSSNWKLKFQTVQSCHIHKELHRSFKL